MKTLVMLALSVMISLSSTAPSMLGHGGISSIGPRAVDTNTQSSSDDIKTILEDGNCPIIGGKPCCNPWYCGGGV
jgi:hypothetical protein